MAQGPVGREVIVKLSDAPGFLARVLAVDDKAEHIKVERANGKRLWAPKWTVVDAVDGSFL